jgi:hypothetical protein
MPGTRGDSAMVMMVPQALTPSSFEKMQAPERTRPQRGRVPFCPMISRVSPSIALARSALMVQVVPRSYDLNSRLAPMYTMLGL